MKLLEKIERYTLYVTVFLLPISFFYISPNPFVVSKLAVLVAGLSIFFLVRSIRIIVSGKLEFVSGSFDLAALVLLVAYILSTVLRTPNKMEALLLPGTATIFVGAILMYFAVNQLDKPGKRLLAFALSISGAIYSVLTTLAFSGLMAKMTFLPPFVQSKSFTPEGGYLPTLIFLLTMLPMAISFALSNTKKFKLVSIISSVLILVGVGVSIYNLMPGKPFSPRFVSFGESWNITVDSLKVSPILGMGPGNYLTAFNRFRTISYNASDLWAVKFSTARSSLMTVATEAGLLGILGLALVIFASYKLVSKTISESITLRKFSLELGYALAVAVLIVSAIVAPMTLLPVVTLFIFMAVISKNHEYGVVLTGQRNSEEGVSSTLAAKLPAFIVTAPIIGILVFTGIRATQILLAENAFKSSIDALAKNNPSETYDTMRKAVSLNPRVDRYRVTFSRVNLVLANAIAAKGKDLTDSDRANITTLIQQSINESKAAVALNPLRAGNWESLAEVYRAIIPLAKGSDEFAIQSLRQAIVLDPINPQLRIALGGLYFAKGDFENSVKVFELAVAAKPDHANARYNLAVALEKAGKLDAAIQQMSVVVTLVKADSKDAEVAKKALSDMQAKKKGEAPTGEELVPPQGNNKQVIEPPIELPSDAEPPEAPIASPTPTISDLQPSVTPTPSPNQ